MQKISVTLQDKNSNSKFLIEDRRRTVARLLAQSMTETEIAIRLDVHTSIDMYDSRLSLGFKINLKCVYLTANTGQ